MFTTGFWSYKCVLRLEIRRELYYTITWALVPPNVPFKSEKSL